MALVFKFRHDYIGFFRHLLVNILALLVVFVDMLSLAQGCRKIFLHKQVYALFTILHTSGSIDARSNLEHNIAHRQFATV